MPLALTLVSLKRGLLLGWAVWFSIIATTNAANALVALGVLPPGWWLSSHNWQFLETTFAVYQTTGWLAAVLFAGVIPWELLAAALFWRAIARCRVGN